VDDLTGQPLDGRNEDTLANTPNTPLEAAHPAATLIAGPTLTATFDGRFRFTWQFLAGAAAQSRDAFAIEARPIETIGLAEEVAHRSHVVAAIMQATAALESEAWEVWHHGFGEDALTRKQTKALLSPLADLRNEVVHYKSMWGAEAARKKLFKALEARDLPRPPFVAENVAGGFFPLKCLSASCAAWAVESSLALMESFYLQLEANSPREQYEGLLDPRP
jgi:hypothetical protein